MVHMVHMAYGPYNRTYGPYEVYPFYGPYTFYGPYSPSLMVHIPLSPYNTRPLGLMVHIVCVTARYTNCYQLIVYGPYGSVTVRYNI